MYDIGIKNITNIDLSEIVVKQMSEKNKHLSGMQFLKMDMLKMDFEESIFDVVIDKGTLDALMSDISEKVQDDCNKLFAELDRVLKVGGRYICVSLAQDHILDKILSSFKEKYIFRFYMMKCLIQSFRYNIFSKRLDHKSSSNR
jgi:ubiquinone/menaquinone biosynthesis C-methylase UbiE